MSFGKIYNTYYVLNFYIRDKSFSKEMLTSFIWLCVLLSILWYTRLNTEEF